jgi:hypothetical protein
MSLMKVDSFSPNGDSSYFHLWLSEWLDGLRSLAKDIIVIVVAFVTLFVQWRMGWIQIGHGWETIVVNLSPPLGVLLVFLVFSAFRAVRQLDRRRMQEIVALRNVFETWPGRVESIKLLRGYHREGELLKEELEKVDYPLSSLEQRTKTWRMSSANMLLQQRGETDEERFNRIDTRSELTELAKLHEQIYELKKAMDEVGALVASDAQDT